MHPRESGSRPRKDVIGVLWWSRPGCTRRRDACATTGRVPHNQTAALGAHCGAAVPAAQCGRGAHTTTDNPQKVRGFNTMDA